MCGGVYLSLDHVLAVQAQHTAVQVDVSFRVQLLQNPIQSVPAQHAHTVNCKDCKQILTLKRSW